MIRVVETYDTIATISLEVLHKSISYLLWPIVRTDLVAGPLKQKRRKREITLWLPIAYETTQNVDKPTRAPVTAGHHTNHLDLFLTSYSDQCSAVLSPFSTSDYCLIHFKVVAKTKLSTEMPFHRTTDATELIRRNHIALYSRSRSLSFLQKTSLISE